MQIILVSPCVFNRALQVDSSKVSDDWGKPFRELLNTVDIQIIPLVCTETEFCGCERKRHGIDYYSSLNGYKEYCMYAAQEVLKQIQSLPVNNLQRIICIGIEHSPSCAVSYMYSKRGMLKRKGIFFECLSDLFQRNQMNCQMIGINRKYPRKAYERLVKIITE